MYRFVRLSTPMARRRFHSWLLAVVAILTLACNDAGVRVGAGDLTTTEDRASYGIGLELGRSLERQGVEVNVDALVTGLHDGLSGTEPLITDAEVQTSMLELQESVNERQQARLSQEAEANRAAGEAFLAENAERSDVVTLPSGLQYEVLEEGSGPSPSDTDTVTVHYRGTKIDGTVFDSSYDRGQPATFSLAGVIPGWAEGVQQMNVGARYKLYIPAELAYGMNPPDPSLGPASTLVFEVELLEIVER